MADYQKMYYLLCAAASKALDVLPPGGENEAARAILEEALLAAEDMYIENEQ